MAGGPIHPYMEKRASMGTTNQTDLYNGVFDPTSGNWRYNHCWICDTATLAADVVLHLGFEMPGTLPSGTATLRLVFQASSTGDFKVSPAWASVAMEEDPEEATFSSEGTQTVTFDSGDGNVFKQLKVVLDADTVVAGEIIAMKLTIVDSGTTVTVPVRLSFISIIWDTGG